MRPAFVHFRFIAKQRKITQNNCSRLWQIAYFGIRIPPSKSKMVAFYTRFFVVFDECLKIGYFFYSKWNVILTRWWMSRYQIGFFIIGRSRILIFVFVGHFHDLISSIIFLIKRLICYCRTRLLLCAYDSSLFSLTHQWHGCKLRRCTTMFGRFQSEVGKQRGNDNDEVDGDSPHWHNFRMCAK